MATESLKYKQIGRKLLDDLIPNDRGNYNGEDVINALLKASGGLIGKRIKERREAMHVGQGDLQAALDCSQSEVAKIEAGTRAISVEDAKALAKVFNVTPEWILTGK